MVDIGTQVENITGSISASACLADFVFLRPMRLENRTKKELSDLLLELDGKAICIQIKAQGTGTRRAENEQVRWANKHLCRAAQQTCGALRVLQLGLYPIETLNPRRGRLVFSGHDLHPIHGLVLIDYDGPPLQVPKDAPARGHSNIPIHYMTCVDFFELIGHLGTLPDFIRYLSERARLPSWTAPLIGSEKDAYAYYLMHEQEFAPTLARDSFEGRWESLTAVHQEKYLRKIEEDRFAEVVNRIIDEVHRTDPEFETQLPEELVGRIPSPDRVACVKVATELNKMPKIVRREVGKKLLAKARLAASTGKPRWFARYDEDGKVAFLFLVSSLPRKSRFRALHNLLMALLCKVKLSRGVGVALSDPTVERPGVEFLWVEDVYDFDQMTRDMSTKLFSAEKHERYFDFPDESNRIIIPEDT